ncbi:hypothetical protein PIB30_017680 [Stylosanthes scabra]|uniref:Uncharacterized protein n=1 Tax=Stylosanthes scabra TaxID=79078 RepID=A0ABU6Z9F5_9FABA|nr:hypothetical protein [Stylosanthes scabra]
MSCRFSQIVVRVYPNGVPREGPDGVEFHSPDPFGFIMWPITLGASTSNPEPEVHAPMTADPVDVVLPHEYTGETESDGEDSGDSDSVSSGSGDNEFVGTTPVGTRFLLPAPLLVPTLSTVDSHFHTLDLDAMEEDRLTDIGGGGDDYNLDRG